MTREVTLTLPAALAGEAEQAGLLKAEAIERLLREEIRRRRIEQLFSAADRLAAQGGPTLTAEEIEAEIAAVRKERHDARTSSR